MTRKTIITIKAIPQYLITVSKPPKKEKRVEGVSGLKDKENATPMDILLKAKKDGLIVHNFRVDPDCPAVIVLRID